MREVVTYKSITIDGIVSLLRRTYPRLREMAKSVDAEKNRYGRLREESPKDAHIVNTHVRLMQQSDLLRYTMRTLCEQVSYLLTISKLINGEYEHE